MKKIFGLFGRLRGLFSKRLLVIGGLVLYLAFMTYILIPSNLPKPFYIEVNWDGRSASAASAESEQGATPTPNAVEAAAPGHEPISPEVASLLQGKGVMLSVGPKIFNLADPGGRRYLKVSLVLEVLPSDMTFYTITGEQRALAEESFLEELKTKTPLIEDALTTAITSKTYEEVFTIAGKEALKKELLEAINPLMDAEEVAHIYFTDFLIQ